MTKCSVLLTGATGSVAGLLPPALRKRYQLRLIDARSMNRDGRHRHVGWPTGAAVPQNRRPAVYTRMIIVMYIQWLLIAHGLVHAAIWPPQAFGVRATADQHGPFDPIVKLLPAAAWRSFG